MTKLAKTVLLLHRNNEQGNIWKLILTLRGLDVIWESRNNDIVNWLEKFQEARASLPSLLLLEILFSSLPNCIKICDDECLRLNLN
jgi:hypothetical protein